MESNIGCYKWINNTLPKFNKREANHCIRIAPSERGKTYHQDWFTEYYHMKKIGKVFHLHCTKNNMLQERLTLMYPNVFAENKEIKKICNPKLNPYKEPHGFKVKVYLPVSAEAPNRLPSNFVPFTIPINDLGENAIQTLYGAVDSSRIYNIYKNQIKTAPQNEKITYASFKNTFRKYKFKLMHYQKGYMNVPVLTLSSKAHARTVDGFLSRMQLFNQSGIVATGQSELSLKKQLEKELMDPEATVVLYTGYLKSTTERYFVMAYFIQCITELLDSGIKEKIPYKIVLSFDEVRFLFPSREENRKGIHTGMADLGATLLTEGRHSNLEIWLAVQSPHFIPENMYPNIHTKFVFPLKAKKDIEWFGEHYPETYKREIVALFKKMDRQISKGIYAFLVMEEELSNTMLSLYDGKIKGYLLPRQRISFYKANHDGIELNGKVPVLPENFEVLKHDPQTMDLGIELTDDMKIAKKKLAKEFLQSERELKEVLEEERKQRKEAKKREEDDQLIPIVAKLFNEGKNETTVAKIIGKGRDKTGKLYYRALEKGLIETKEEEKAPVEKAET